jgi:adenylate kinase
MAAGKLVDDETVIGMVADAIKSPECSHGFILDGSPRTVNQARMLDALLAKQNIEVDRVINLEIDDELLVKRITGRVIHLASGRSYNIYFNPPKVVGKDDVTGEPLISRADDNEETLRKRLQEFHSQTKPVLEYYAAHGKVTNVNADNGVDAVTQVIRSALNAK